MRYITKEDRETLTSINMICNIAGDRESVYQNLYKNYKERPMDATSAFAFGFYNFLIASKNKSSTIGSERIEMIFNAYNDALTVVPDYWLVLMFKSVLLLSLPEVLRNDDELIKTIHEMVEHQKKVKSQPYFMIPYIIYADFLFATSNREFVFDVMEEAKREVVISEVNDPILLPYFRMPFKDFLKRLLKSNEFELASEIKSIGKRMFPLEKIFLESTLTYE